MKRGSQLTLKIDGIKFPSTGISECEGKKVYVKGAFPGQTVKATVKKKREGYAEANGLPVDFADKKDLHIRKLEKALDKACELLEKHRIGTTCDEENYKKCMENHCFNSCIHLRNMTKEELKEWCMKDE